MKMKILYFAGIIAFLYAVQCKPTSMDDYEETYGPLVDDNIQNDNENDYGDYDEPEKAPDDENAESYAEEEPSISTLPGVFTKTENETIELPCKITGGSNAVQIWRKGASILFQSGVKMAASPNIKIKQDGSIEISNLTRDNAGKYECEALYDQLTKSPSIIHTLEINTRPQIVQISAKNNNTILKHGETLILTCKANGYPKPTISWHKGSERLGTEGETLIINNVKHHDAGIYRCLADNTIGDPAHAIIQIKVEFKPVVTIEKISVNSDTNHDTELKCIVHSEPQSQVVWKKDKVNIVNSDHIQLTNTGNNHILILKGLQESDFGTYVCLAVNYLGETEKHIKLVKTPAVLKFVKPKLESKDVVLTWEVQSKSPIKKHELEYRKKGESSWLKVNPEVTETENDIYTVKYTLKGLEPGTYETRVRSQNNHGWSEYSEIMPFEGVYVKHHGHHGKNSKKGHKDKEKHISSAQPEVTTQSTNAEGDKPAEHQASGLAKNAPPVGASESSGASSITCTASLVSIAIIIFLQIRQ